MNEEFKKQLAQWSYENKYDEIIEALGSLPVNELDFFAAHRLALAYNNRNRLQESIDLLTLFESEGENDAVWNYYIGYALLFSDRNEEARKRLLRARELNPKVPAEDILHYCVCYDGSPDDLIKESLCKWVCEMLDGEIADGAAYLPKFRSTIDVYADTDVKPSGICTATLFFSIRLHTGVSFIEHSAGIGIGLRDAISSALGDFYNGFYSGFGNMHSGEVFAEIKDGLSRVWKVYASNMTMRGKGHGVSDTVYWELLKQAVPDYLGSRNITYVKLFGAKQDESITAECRVNNFISHDLGELLHNSVKEWKNSGFATLKQIFFLVCEDEGEPYPYSQEQINSYVKTAVEMFSDPDIDYDDIFDKLSATVGDANLANELFGFIPEICAEMAFENIKSEDKFSITTGDEAESEAEEEAEGGTKGEKEEEAKGEAEYTKWQITSFHMIYEALNQGFEDNIYPENAFGSCVAPSSIYGVILKAKEDGYDMEESGGSIRLFYSFHKDYIAR